MGINHAFWPVLSIFSDNWCPFLSNTNKMKNFSILSFSLFHWNFHNIIILSLLLHFFSSPNLRVFSFSDPLNWDVIWFLSPLGSLVQTIAHSSVLWFVTLDFFIRVQCAIILFVSSDITECSAIKILVTKCFAFINISEILSISHLGSLVSVHLDARSFVHLPVGSIHRFWHFSWSFVKSSSMNQGSHLCSHVWAWSWWHIAHQSQFLEWRILSNHVWIGYLWQGIKVVELDWNNLWCLVDVHILKEKCLVV